MHKDIYKNHTATLIFICLGVLITYLNINYSKDWEGYKFWYSLVEARSWSHFFGQFSLMNEPLYKASSKWVSELIGFGGFVVLATVSLLTLKLHYLKKIVGNVFLATFFYVCLYLLLFEGTVIRVAYATSFIVMALYFLGKERYKLAVFSVLLASQIHFTAILFLLIFPIYFINSLRRVLWVIFTLSPLFILTGFSAFSVFENIIEWVNPRYLEYNKTKLVNQNSTGLYYYFIAFFAVVILLVHMYLKEKIASDRFCRALHSICMVGIIFMCLFHTHVAIGARIGELLLLPLVVLLSWVSMELYKKELHLQQAGLLGLMMAYFAARWAYLYPTMFV